MQIPHQNPYAQLGTGIYMYKKINEGCNNIGDVGLLHLSKATWRKISALSVSTVREK
jgi:hypothetical protein